MSQKDIVLAFSGGLDTSFCVPYLQERGYRVHTVFADTGGVDAEERAYIEARAHELGVASHVTVDGGPAHLERLRQALRLGRRGLSGPVSAARVGPLSDRRSRAQALRRTRHESHCARLHRHGQRSGAFRPDDQGAGRLRRSSRRSAKSRRNTRRRAPTSSNISKQRGFGVRAKQKSYTINENLLGVTMSGGEIDRWEAPGEGARGWCASRARMADRSRCARRSRFANGEAVALNGEALAGHELLAQTQRASSRSYGVGRGLYTGDTTIGLKGRIIFEAPGSDRAAHRASRARGGRAEQAAEPLQARRRAQVGRTGLRGVLPRSAQGRSRGVPGLVAALRERRGDAGNAWRQRRRRRGRDRRTFSMPRARPTRSRPTGAWRRRRVSSGCSA